MILDDLMVENDSNDRPGAEAKQKDNDERVTGECVTTCTTGTCPCNTANVRVVACRVSGKTEGCLCNVFGTWGRDTGGLDGQAERVKGWVGLGERNTKPLKLLHGEQSTKQAATGRIG